MQLFFPEPASAIQLATDFDFPEVLRTAFYRLAVSRPDCQYEKGPYRDPGLLSARWDLLDAEAWRRYNKGKAALVTAFTELPKAWKCRAGNR